MATTVKPIAKDAPKERRRAASSSQGGKASKRVAADAKAHAATHSSFSNGIVLMVDRRQRIMVAEGGGLRLIGIERSNLVGRTMSETLPREMLEEVAPLHGQALLDIPSEKEMRFARGMLHLQVVPVREGDAPASGALLLFTDVTKQREQERALQESEARLKSVFDHALIGIYRTTPDGKILMANPALVRMLGFSSFEELARRDLNNEGFDISMRRSEHLAEIERDGYATGLETTWRRADGKMIQVRDNATAIKDRDGRTIYYEGTVEDITEHKRMEEQVRRDKDFISSIIEASKSLVVGLDEKGEVVLFNNECEAVTGWDRADAQGKNWFRNFVSERSRAMSELAFDRAMGGQSSQWVDSVTTTEGEKVIIWQNTLVKREEGSIVVSIGVDITEKERYKAQIEELNQSLRIVNSILRHDIMNDLTVAGGSLELFRKNRDEKLISMAEASMKKISDLIRKMKELESIISTHELKVVSARDVLREVVSHYSSLPVQFEVEGDCLIWADEALVPALDNIVNNAIVHGRTDRVEVTIKAEPGGQTCQVRIADLGKGVPAEIKGMIFQEGFRYGETGNTGLGLYIVKKTMERYGGKVSVEDNEPRGAVFVLRFRSGNQLAKTGA